MSLPVAKRKNLFKKLNDDLRGCLFRSFGFATILHDDIIDNCINESGSVPIAVI